MTRVLILMVSNDVRLNQSRIWKDSNPADLCLAFPTSTSAKYLKKKVLPKREINSDDLKEGLIIVL